MLFDETIDTHSSTTKKKKSDENEETQNSPPRVGGRSRVTPTTTSITTAGVEKVLLNGDFYMGSFSGNVPNGSGKYLWADGSMYEGEWKRGKASGKGRFSWPSGATYEGEFKSGRMDGFGTFTGSDGDTYQGTWRADRKHGFGRKCYANGDFYEGSWKRNLHDGHGRYVWGTGNEYVGEWKNGVICGRGVLIWANGSRYEGHWENGVPKKDMKIEQLNGTFYVGNANRRLSVDSLVAGSRKPMRRWSVDGVRVSSEERKFPKICIWESDGEAGDITCNIVDNVKSSTFYQDWTVLDPRGFMHRPCSAGEMKRPGHTVSKGHKNYELMLNLQLGIRNSVGGRYASITRELRPSDFDPRQKFWSRFPSAGSKVTPPHQSTEFRWKDYCPVVFRHLRELFQVNPADYMLAICGNDALREFSSPGKSGSIFYLTQDERFMIKTVKKSEVKVLIRMLPSYHQHVCLYENSLVTKFFGVHCVKPIGGQKTRFIVMGNLFCSEYRIHRRFDLKGSSYGRITDKPNEEISETSTLKDLDLNFVFRLEGNLFQELMKQISRDCEFLEAERIMDYSLLVGVHFRDVNSGEKIGVSPFIWQSGRNASCQSENFTNGCPVLDDGFKHIDRIVDSRKPSVRLGANMSARAERIATKGEFDQYTPGRINHLIPSRSGEIYEVVLYFGIIDILQDYDISKKLEHAYKSLQADPSSISAVDPKLYSKRFRDFIGRIFEEER